MSLTLGGNLPFVALCRWGPLLPFVVLCPRGTLYPLAIFPLGHFVLWDNLVKRFWPFGALYLWRTLPIWATLSFGNLLFRAL